MLCAIGMTFGLMISCDTCADVNTTNLCEVRIDWRVPTYHLGDGPSQRMCQLLLCSMSRTMSVSRSEDDDFSTMSERRLLHQDIPNRSKEVHLKWPNVFHD